jgi:hypothetical protein
MAPPHGICFLAFFVPVIRMCCPRRAAAGATRWNEHGEIGCEPFFHNRAHLINSLVAAGIPAGRRYHDGIEYSFFVTVDRFRVGGDIVAGSEVLQIKQ